MSDNFDSAGKMNKVGDEENSGSKGKAHSRMPGFAGNLYQAKWLMWYLLKGLSSKQHRFELGTEIEQAGKYDDLVLKYRKVVDGNERDHFIIMQSKHKTTDKTITYQDILTDANVDLGLVKYFNSFVESKNDNMFKDGVIEHAIIYTNARFDMDEKIPEKDKHWKKLKNIKDITEEMKLENDILSVFEIKKGKFYQFKHTLVYPVLKSMILDYKYYEIAQKLINTSENQKQPLSLEDKILKKYNHLLLTEVIDKETKMFRGDFLSCDDDENDTGRAKLRRALNKVLKNKKLKVTCINKKVFEWEKSFEKPEQTKQSWPDIDADLEEFLKKSVFATEQPNEKSLGKIILNELHKQFFIYDTDFIYSHFYAKIQDWMRGEKFFIDKCENISTSKFISFKDANNFFENMKRKFEKIILKGPITDYDHYIQEYNINFIDLEFKNALKEFLDSDLRILNIINKHIMISSIKLYMELKKTIKLEEFIYIKLSSSNKHSLNSAIRTFESESTDHILVIEWDCDETKLDKWKDEISDIINTIQSHNKKKLIIISNRDNILKKYFQNDFFVDTKCVERRDIANTLTNLEKDSQECFLDTIVKFQGKNAKLKDFIINDDLKKAVDGNILLKILKKEDINIGKQIEGLKSDMQQCYIDRTFMRIIENEENVYLISKINEGDLCSENNNFEIIEEYESSQRNKFNTFKLEIDENNKNIYLLKNKSLEKSNGLILLKKTKNPFKVSDFNNAIKFKHKKCEINLISALAGTGKSTLFAKLSQKIKDQNSELWVIKIDLNALSSKLREIKNSKMDIQFETVIDLLYHHTTHQSELEETIFKHRLHNKSIVLLLDGFDEVCPGYKSIVLKMIKILENKAAIKAIWISTRPYDSILIDMKESFANLYVKDYNFEPLTEDRQKEYLKNVWEQSLRVNEKFFKLFVKELFELFNNNIKGEFLGVPLHIMLIGVTLKDTFEEFQNTNEYEISREQQQKLSEIINLSSLYDKFVRFKCEIYLKNGSYSNLDTEAGKNVFNETYESCLKKIKILALNSLFGENKLQTLLTDTELKKLEKYKNNIKERGDPFGVINQIADGKPQFVHRTFAEYFVAVFLVENFMKEEKKSQEIIVYFLKNMINVENSVICDFIDSKLSDEPNFIEYSYKYGNVVKEMDGGKLYFVLENRWQNIGEILIKNEIDMNYQNFGETILASASKLQKLKDKKSILRLISEKVDFDKNKLKKELQKPSDNLFNYNETPLLISINNSIFENVKILFEMCKKKEILEDILIDKTEQGENMIHLAANSNCNDDFFIKLLTLLKSETKMLKTILTQKESDGHSPFDTAVKNGQRKKFETMWNLCEELGISTDDVLFRETKRGENIIHLAAIDYCDNDFFTYMLNLLKNKPAELKTILIKRNSGGYTPFDRVVMYGQQNKSQTILNLCGELDISTNDVLFNETERNENILHLAATKYCNNDFFTYLLNLLNSELGKLKSLLTKKNSDDCTPFGTAVKNGQREKFETMLNLCGKLDIPADSILFNETERGGNVIHLAATKYCDDDFFTYLLNLLKSKPSKLKTILMKKNSDGHTPFNTAEINGQHKKMDIMSNLNRELDNISNQ